MNIFICKWCRKEISPSKDFGIAKWEDADESVNGFLKWTCLLAPQLYHYKPKGPRGTGSIAIGYHEPDKRTIEESLTRLDRLEELETDNC